MYSETILDFPSLLETYGLPLLEAALHNTPILSANLNYAREVLDTYEKVIYFDPFNPKEFSNLLINIIDQKFTNFFKKKSKFVIKKNALKLVNFLNDIIT